MKKTIAVLLALVMMLGVLPLSALAKPIEYMVTYVAGEGWGTMVGDVVEAGGSFTLEPCAFEAPDGYVFSAWAIGSVSGEKKQPGDTITITQETYIYALWTKSGYTITYVYPFTEEEIKDTSVAAGSYTLPSCEFTPIPGIQFWIWEVNGVLKAPGDTIQVASSLRVNALWKVIGDSITIELVDQSKISGYSDLQLFGLEMLSDKGFLVMDQEALGYRNKQGRLLFTFDDEGNLFLEEGLVPEDNVTYLLSAEEREAILIEFGIDIPQVKVIVCPEQLQDAEVIVDLKTGDSISDLSLIQKMALSYLMETGTLVFIEHDGIGEVSDEQGKLLFTMDSNGVFTLASGLTQDDNLDYELTTKEQNAVKENYGKTITRIQIIFGLKEKPGFQSNIIVLNMKSGLNMNEFDFMQGIMFDLLLEKGALVLDRAGKGYNREGKHLFTIDDNGNIVIADGVTSEDTLVYELPAKEQADMENYFGESITHVQVNFLGNERSVVLSTGRKIGDLSEAENDVLDILDFKGLIRVEQVGEGLWVSDANGRLLFTVNNRGVITLGGTITRQDKIEYTLLPEEQLEGFEGVEKVVLKFALAVNFGDVDGNGTVDAADALKTLQHAVKLITLEGEAYTAANVNGDDKVDAADALLILQHTVKLIDKFPAEAVA